MTRPLKPVRPYRAPPPARKHPPDPRFAAWRDRWQELMLDLGCGAGLHPLRLAAANPRIGIVGIERTRTRFAAFAGRLRNHRLPNIHAVHGDAQDWIPANLASASVDAIYLLYPNPYPKEAQANKRWHRHPLMHILLDILRPHGRLVCASNEPSYIDECRHYLQHYWGLENIIDTPVPHTAAHRPRSHFERKYLQRGQPCHTLAYRRPHSCPPPAQPVPAQQPLTRTPPPP